MEIIDPESSYLPQSKRRTLLKRTRRVEVIRYSRRSSVTSNEVAFEPDLTAEQEAIDILLGIPSNIECPIEDASSAGRQVSDVGVSGVVQRHRPLRLLKRLIRG
jgi:hypothetical protein